MGTLTAFTGRLRGGREGTATSDAVPSVAVPAKAAPPAPTPSGSEAPRGRHRRPADGDAGRELR